MELLVVAGEASGDRHAADVVAALRARKPGLGFFGMGGEHLKRQGVEASDTTVRRPLHTLGYRWKRPKFVLGRPDPAYEAKRGPSPSAPA